MNGLLRIYDKPRLQYFINGNGLIECTMIKQHPAHSAHNWKIIVKLYQEVGVRAMNFIGTDEISFRT